MASNKKETAKKAGIIACIGTGLFGLYQLLFGGNGIDSEFLDAIKTILKPLHDKAHEYRKQMIKEALKEYELEKNKVPMNNK